MCSLSSELVTWGCQLMFMIILRALLSETSISLDKLGKNCRVVNVQLFLGGTERDARWATIETVSLEIVIVEDGGTGRRRS